MKKILWRLFARKNYKCQWCENMTCVSNYSPCYSCYKFSNFEEYKNMPTNEMYLRNISLKDIKKNSEGIE